jgi:hypothetical protein
MTLRTARPGIPAGPLSVGAFPASSGRGDAGKAPPRASGGGGAASRVCSRTTSRKAASC